MASTSKSSDNGNFPLGVLNKGPGYYQREAPCKEQQQTKKSAMERLTESRAKFVRKGSRDELDDAPIGEENQPTPHHHKSSGHEGHIVRAVPYVLGDKSLQSAKRFHSRSVRPPPPVPDKPTATIVLTRKGSRDRTLEIVEASLPLSERQNASLQGDSTAHQIISPGNLFSTSSSNSNSSRESPPSTGSRVRKLREQFLKIGSTEGESDTSQGRVTPTDLRKSGSSSSSSKEGTIMMHPTDTQDIQEQIDVDPAKINLTNEIQFPAVSKSKLPETKHFDADMIPARCRTASSGDELEPEINPASSTDVLNDQTRRQMERFKARHATSTVTKEANPERKISRIVLKPPSQATEPKERRCSANEPSRKLSSSLVRARAHSSNEEDKGHSHSAVALGTDLFVRPQVQSQDHRLSENIRISTIEKEHNDGLSSHQIHPASFKRGGGKLCDPDVKTSTAEDIQNQRQAKDPNFSGISPERWGKTTGKSKTHEAVIPRPAVQQVSGRAFSVMKPRLEDEKKAPSLEVSHRRAKSDLDRGDTSRTSAEAVVHHARHHSHDDQVHVAAVSSVPKVSALDVSYRHISEFSPDNVQKKSWAPVTFNQDQDRNKKGKGTVGKESSSNDGGRSSQDVPETLKPRAQPHHLNTPKQIFSPEVAHAQAKSKVQNFLDGRMKSPPVASERMSNEKTKQQDTEENHRNTQPQDSNGNRIPSASSGRHGKTTTCTNLNETTPNRPYRTKSRDEVNSNVYISAENGNKVPQVSLRFAASKDIELSAIAFPRDQRDGLKTKDVQIPPGRKTSRQQDNRKVQRPEPSNDRLEESDKRRKFSQNSDTSSSRHDGLRPDRNEQVHSKNEEPRVKKLSLAELLSKDVDRTEVPDQATKTQKAVARRQGRQESDLKWRRSPQSDSCHGDNSETDSDEELRKSKVLRVKKSRNENKKDDNSLQNLLSRIINPEDDLNTLKRGKKRLETKKREQEAEARKSKTESNNTKELENNKPVLFKLAAPRERSRASHQLNIKRQANDKLINMNRKADNAERHDDSTVSPSESLTSPTRRLFTRRRSKSDLGMSPRCSMSSAHSEVEHFFNQMGMNDSFLQGQLSPPPLSPGNNYDTDEDEVFHEMHEYKHRDDGDYVSSDNSGNLSQGSRVSNEGLHRAKELPDTSKSIITKNARVIKWLVQIRKARASSIS